MIPNYSAWLKCTGLHVVSGFYFLSPLDGSIIRIIIIIIASVASQSAALSLEPPWFYSTLSAELYLI